MYFVFYDDNNNISGISGSPEIIPGSVGYIEIDIEKISNIIYDRSDISTLSIIDYKNEKLLLDKKNNYFLNSNIQVSEITKLNDITNNISSDINMNKTHLYIIHIFKTNSLEVCIINNTHVNSKYINLYICDKNNPYLIYDTISLNLLNMNNNTLYSYKLSDILRNKEISVISNSFLLPIVFHKFDTMIDYYYFIDNNLPILNRISKIKNDTTNTKFLKMSISKNKIKITLIADIKNIKWPAGRIRFFIEDPMIPGILYDKITIETNEIMTRSNIEYAIKI